MWGSGRGAPDLFASCLNALADDESVDVVALAVDLVPEYDGDDAYPRALATVSAHTSKPVVVLSNLSSAIDQALATRLRASGIPVLEGTRSGLRALGQLLAQADPACPATASVDVRRQRKWSERLTSGIVDALALLADYGVPVAPSEPAGSAEAALAAAERLGYPVVLKTGRPDINHKVDVAGVRLGLADAAAVRTAYADLAARLGPAVLVQRQVPEGVELAVGIWRDPHLGPLVLIAPGGTLVELLDERAVALPPVNPETALRLLTGLKVNTLLAGHRGSPPLDVEAVVAAIVPSPNLRMSWVTNSKPSTSTP